MSKELIESVKYKMKDLKYGDPIPEDCNIIQVKFDGWFTHVEIQNGIAVVTTSGGETRKVFDAPIPDCVILAEWMYGTNASQKHPMKDKFLVYDLLELKGNSLKDNDYEARFGLIRSILEDEFIECNTPFRIVSSYAVDSFNDLWEDLIKEKGNEGVVFRNSWKKFGEGNMYRMKREFSNDYVVVGFKEGTNRLTGTLGALEGGLYDSNGKLHRILSVGGGFTDHERDEIWNSRELYYGKVFEASGKALFESGALRHPNFVRFRYDKSPKECIL